MNRPPPSLSDTTLSLDAVGVAWGDRRVLSEVSLTIPRGSRVTVIGRSGAGKSTLLRLLNRLIEPTHGRILLGGLPISAWPAPALRRRVGLVFQAPRPLPGTIAENLAYPGTIAGRPTGDFAAAMREVGLDPAWLDRDAAGLSGGERQRLALATALQVGPEILALDEPTAALDPASAASIAAMLHERSRRDGLTTIAVTHDRSHAAQLGTRTIVLDAGRVVDDGPTPEVLARADAAAFVANRGDDA